MDHERITKELVKGLQSGPSRPMTKKDWEELKRRVRERANLQLRGGAFLRREPGNEEAGDGTP